MYHDVCMFIVAYFISLRFKGILIFAPWRWQDNSTETCRNYVNCTHKLQNCVFVGFTQVIYLIIKHGINNVKINDDVNWDSNRRQFGKAGRREFLMNIELQGRAGRGKVIMTRISGRYKVNGLRSCPVVGLCLAFFRFLFIV